MGSPVNYIYIYIYIKKKTRKWVSRTHKPTFLRGKVWLLEILYPYIFQVFTLDWCYEYMYIYLILYAQYKQPPLKPLHSTTLDTTTWFPRHDFYVPLASLKRWRFITMNSSRVSQVELKNTQESKELYEKVQVKFINYCHLYIYIKKIVYRDDKLEEDWKCKTRRKTNWKRIQSVKQVEKRSRVWKKMGKKYIF